MKPKIIGLLFLILLSGRAWSETSVPDDPAREMLTTHFQGVEDRYHRAVLGLPIPSDLGLSRADLLDGLKNLSEALAHWKIEFEPGNAALAVHVAERRLSVNPESMQDILESADDFSLLHESVHLVPAQENRQLYALHNELVFVDWLQDHVDEDRAQAVESKAGHVLGVDDLLAHQLWSPALRTDPVPRRAAARALRESWICEIQAYEVQLLAIDRAMRQSEGRSLHDRVGMVKRILASETGSAAPAPGPDDPSGFLGDDDVGLAVFKSFNPRRVTPGFQEAVLECVLLNPHNALVFRMLASVGGWNMAKARTSASYRRQLFDWAARTMLQWDRLSVDPYALSADERQELRREGLLDPDALPQR